MVGKPLTLEVPDYLYERMRQRAAHTRRSIQDEAVDALATGLLATDESSMAIAEQVAYLDQLDDESVRQAARARLSDQDDARLAELNEKAEREGLTEDEAQESAALLDRGETMMVIRAKAALILKQRGYDVSELLPN